LFAGIVEATGELKTAVRKGTNLELEFSCPFTQELKIDQSVAHNGVCLTVTEIGSDSYKLVAIDETLKKSNLGSLQVGHKVNLERCLELNARIDGHMVQGHVDTVGKIVSIEDQNGSWLFRIEHPDSPDFITVEKGSICVNGISLTVVNSENGAFSVAIIPYTYENTNLADLKIGDEVNLEFDIIGKYVGRYLARSQS
jgi:riboflavin synthase